MDPFFGSSQGPMTLLDQQHPPGGSQTCSLSSRSRGSPAEAASQGVTKSLRCRVQKVLPGGFGPFEFLFNSLRVCFEQWCLDLKLSEHKSRTMDLFKKGHLSLTGLQTGAERAGQRGRETEIERVIYIYICVHMICISIYVHIYVQIVRWIDRQMNKYLGR